MLLSASLLERNRGHMALGYLTDLIDSLIESCPDWELIDGKCDVDLIGCVVAPDSRDPGAVVQVRDVDNWTYSCSVTRECYIHLQHTHIVRQQAGDSLTHTHSQCCLYGRM